MDSMMLEFVLLNLIPVKHDLIVFFEEIFSYNNHRQQYPMEIYRTDASCSRPTKILK